MNNFWQGKKVFLTGHTGFKGSWLAKVLSYKGAKIKGFSLASEGEENLFSLCDFEGSLESYIGDIRDFVVLRNEIIKFEPEIIFHLAAQPLVRESYINPRYTYETNVMGTVNILECLKHSKGVKSFINVTTDKVYENNEWEWGYRENERLNGLDPYSNSKSCSELVTYSYKNSILKDSNIAISTVRAGNVIGGGDFSKDRIIPDCIKAARDKKKIIVRNPNSTRPYQHVLEPVIAYMLIAQRQYEDIDLSGSYNVGPNEKDCITTGQLAEIFCDIWGEEQKWENINDNGPHEANFLKLDCSKIKMIFDWKPKWDVRTAVEKTVEWNKFYLEKKNVNECMIKQIQEYMKE